MHRLAALALTLVACRPAPPLDLPICPVLVTAARAVEADVRVLPPDLWFRILVPGFDRVTGLAPENPRDCSQRPVLADTRAAPALPDTRADPAWDEPAGPALPARPRTADDLTFGTSRDGALLVWARLVDYPDGTARGPVVLARWVAQGLEIRGVGSLRAPARRARLHLERLGGEHPLLVAEGEACPVDPACEPGTTCLSGQPTACPREAVLLPLVDQRFLTADLLEGERPVRPARLRLDERRDLPGPGGRTRRLEIRRRLDLRGPSPALHAAIRVRDCLPDRPCSDHLTLLDARPITLADLTIITQEDPWNALLTQETFQ